LTLSIAWISIYYMIYIVFLQLSLYNRFYFITNLRPIFIRLLCFGWVCLYLIVLSFWSDNFLWTIILVKLNDQVIYCSFNLFFQIQTPLFQIQVIIFTLLNLTNRYRNTVDIGKRIITYWTWLWTLRVCIADFWKLIKNQQRWRRRRLRINFRRIGRIILRGLGVSQKHFLQLFLPP
jgi:hypothetical protein